MTPVFPAVTAIVTALTGLLAAFLVVQVIRARVRLGVNAGDGGHAVLAQAIRAHVNLVEQAPLLLLLLALAEASGAGRSLIVGLGAVFVVARLASAWALGRSLGPSTPRQAGAGLTVLVTVATAALAAWRAAAWL
jgi:uncharacterized membrane protein YecN with MAPEG domain